MGDKHIDLTILKRLNFDLKENLAGDLKRVNDLLSRIVKFRKHWARV